MTRLSTHQIDIIKALASDGDWSGDWVTATVDTNTGGFGASLAMGADFNYDEADADAASTMPCTALALEAGTGSKKVLLKGYIRNDSWNWSGGLIYVSTVSGELTQTAPSGSGDQVQVVGYAVTADVMYFSPSLVLVEIA